MAKKESLAENAMPQSYSTHMEGRDRRGERGRNFRFSDLIYNSPPFLETLRAIKSGSFHLEHIFPTFNFNMEEGKSFFRVISFVGRG